MRIGMNLQKSVLADKNMNSLARNIIWHIIREFQHGSNEEQR